MLIKQEYMLTEQMLKIYMREETYCSGCKNLHERGDILLRLRICMREETYCLDCKNLHERGDILLRL